MPVSINGIELSDADMERELPLHQDQTNPLESAMTALILRNVLQQEADKLGLQGDEETRISALLDKAIRVPEPTQEECLSHYQRFPQHFRKGQIAEVSHILYQVTPQVDLEALRAHALAQLAVLQADPSQFVAIAKAQSNCPSGQQGGNLGQMTPGQMVPEFDAAVWKAVPQALIPALVETRFGLHIVALGNKDDGVLVPFEVAFASIATALQQRSFEQALQEYLRQLVQQADIRGADFLPQFQTQSSGVEYAN